MMITTIHPRKKIYAHYHILVIKAILNISLLENALAIKST